MELITSTTIAEIQIQKLQFGVMFHQMRGNIANL